MESIDALLKQSANASRDRMEMHRKIVDGLEASRMLEIGVYKGEFAAYILEACESLQEYYMLDPWRTLEDWNKPANKDDDSFNAFLEETKTKTSFAGERRIFLRGKTTEVIDQIEDESLDVVYIDGDHTLKGITIDLVNAWRKLKPGGLVIGDDFTPSIWQHSSKYEPTMIFPLAVYFAEAVQSPITAVPYDQFVIHKTGVGYQFHDLTGKYGDLSVKHQFSWKKLLKQSAKNVLSIFGLAHRTY